MRSKEGRALLIAPIAANALDAISTKYALDRNPNSIEGNPLMRPMAGNPAAMMVSKVAIGALTGLLAKKLHDKGHKTAARIAGALSISIPLAGAGSNFSRRKGG